MAYHDQGKAAEPDWLEQADQQMSNLFATLEEIDDPSSFEAWEMLEDTLSRLRRQTLEDSQ